MRPWKSAPFILLMAIRASCSTGIDTKAFKVPVVLSPEILTDRTWPKALKAYRKASSLVCGDKFVTQMFISIPFSNPGTHTLS